MSRFTHITTVIRDRAMLCAALRALHYRHLDGENLTIHGYCGNTAKGVVLVGAGSNCDVGFQRRGADSFCVYADWWDVEEHTAVRQDEFLRQIDRSYSHHVVRQVVSRQRLFIEEEIVLPSGDLELLVAKPASI